MKKVTVALEVDNEFMQLLRANVELSRLRQKSMGEGRSSLSVAEQLVLAFYAEARGATEEEVHAFIQPHWRPHIRAVSELRSVKECKE
jgi:hypothetical protein